MPASVGRLARRLAGGSFSTFAGLDPNWHCSAASDAPRQRRQRAQLVGYVNDQATGPGLGAAVTIPWGIRAGGHSYQQKTATCSSAELEALLVSTAVERFFVLNGRAVRIH